MVAALGQLDALVGITYACDYPPQVTDRPVVATRATSGTSLFALDEAKIRELRPDLIITQALCEVCAVSEEDVRSLAARLDRPPTVVTCGGSSLDGVFDDLRQIARALDAESECDELLLGARSRMRQVHDKLKRAKAPRPRVAVIEWSEPLMAAGHWMPEMVRRAGGADLLAQPGAHSERTTVARVRDTDPEVIVVAPCGYDLLRSVEEANRLLGTKEWAWARDRRVVAIDANALSSRPGPRLVDGIEVLARLFNPALFSPVSAASAVVVR